MSCVSGEMVQSMGSSSVSCCSWSTRFSDRRSIDGGRPESPVREISFSPPNKLSSSLPPLFTLFVPNVDSSSVRTVFGAYAICGGGVHGSEWHRLCLLGTSTTSASDAGSSSQSGGGGKVKVREMTDLLGVSKSLIFPPFRSSRCEKGLTRAEGAMVTQGGVSEGCSMSDLLRERRGSDAPQRDGLRRGPTAGEVIVQKKKTTNSTYT